MILLPLLSFISGVLTKYVDICEEHKNRKNLFSYLSGIVYGLTLALIVHLFPVIAPLAVGTVAAMFITKKIDTTGHYLGFGFFIVATLLLGVPYVDLSLFALFIGVNILEEFVNWFVDKGKIRFGKSIIEKRPFLELTCLLLIFTEPLFFVTIFSFDIGYLLVSKIYSSG